VNALKQGAPEQEILSLFRHPETKEQAFNLLVTTYKVQLYWHCRKILIRHDDADDALQNTFLKVWTHLERFRSEAGLYTWLFRIATNESLTILKQRKRKILSDAGTEYENLLAETLEADEYFDGDEAEARLQKAVLALPEKQRLVFNMKYFDEMKYEEISDILETSVGALKASYHHAVKKIENYLKS
jgi:RNA polymerase sigma-70 factor (ECF subfamily)